MTTPDRTKEGGEQSDGTKMKHPLTESQGQKRNRSERLSSHTSLSSEDSPLLQLQRSHGNQAVQRLVNKRIQPKLEVGRSDNKCEREADQAAKRFLQQSVLDRISTIRTDKRGHFTSQITPLAQRQVQKNTTNTVPPVVNEVLQSSGRSLDAATRSSMEAYFGYDFGGVRVHTGAKATESAEAINAQAYTAGHNIVFRKGEYTPRTPEGQRLLVHELTHVVQQKGDEIQREHTINQLDDQEGNWGVAQAVQVSQPIIQRQVSNVENVQSSSEEIPEWIDKSPLHLLAYSLMKAWKERGKSREERFREVQDVYERAGWSPEEAQAWTEKLFRHAGELGEAVGGALPGRLPGTLGGRVPSSMKNPPKIPPKPSSQSLPQDPSKGVKHILPPNPTSRNPSPGTYEPSPKHGTSTRRTPTGKSNPAPKDGQVALNHSVQIKPTSPRRIGIDPKNKEIVVFDETPPGKGVYHGHVRTWDELTHEMQNALRAAGLVDARGNIL